MDKELSLKCNVIILYLTCLLVLGEVILKYFGSPIIYSLCFSLDLLLTECSKLPSC